MERAASPYASRAGDLPSLLDVHLHLLDERLGALEAALAAKPL